MSDIVPDVPGCPDPTVVLALRRATRHFFEQTRIWRMWLAPVSIIKGTLNYGLVLPAQTNLVGLERATLNGRTLSVLTAPSLPSDWQTQTIQQASGVFTEDRTTFNFLPAQTTGDIVKIEVTLKPGEESLGVEDIFFDQYADILATGAKARLMLQPAKPYSNAAMGMGLEQQFNDAITDVSIRRARGFATTSLTVYPRRFAASR